MLGFLLSQLSFSVAAAPCADAVKPGALQAELDSAQAAFLQLDSEAFSTHLTTAETMVPCLSTRLQPEQAAQLHTIQALSAFLARDEQRTLSSFQSADQAAPDTDLIAWLPDGHPANIELRYARRLNTPSGSAFKSPRGQVWIDGRAEDALVISWPMVLQLEVNGILSESHLYQPDQPLPEWIVLKPTPLSTRARRRLTLGAATAAAAIASGTLLAFAATDYGNFFDEDLPYDEMDALRTRTNLLSGASIGAAAIGVGLGTALIVTW